MNNKAWGATIQNREEKFELKRRAVLQSAARIIRGSGFDTMSLGDIALDLHVSKPTIYYYFRNKEDIVRELMEMAVAAFLDPADHPEDYPDAGLRGAERFERFIRRSIRAITADLGGCLFMVYPSQVASEFRQALETIGEPVVTLCDRILREGIADGSVSPCDPVTVYNFMINGLRAVPILLEMRRAPLEKLSDAIVATMAHGIRP